MNKSKATIVFEVRIWNPNHYDEATKRKDKTNVYNGMLRVKNYTGTIPFHSAGDLLTKIESNYFKIVKGGGRNA